VEKDDETVANTNETIEIRSSSHDEENKEKVCVCSSSNIELIFHHSNEQVITFRSPITTKRRMSKKIVDP
jgi:hypothetical protein